MLPYSNNKNLTVINIFGGPGVGKSVTSARLFTELNVNKYNVEYVPEMAKAYTWELRHHMLTEQDYIFAKQHNMLRRLVSQVDVAVCDSPIVLGLMYMPPEFPASFKPFVLDVFNSYRNINIVLKRTVPYDTIGRNQTEVEAIQLDADIIEFLDTNNISYVMMDVNDQLHAQLYSYIETQLQHN
jgi:Cdc6-like AAA superfamily ATPase